MTTITSEILPLLGSKGYAAIYITKYLKEIITIAQSLCGLAKVVSPYELQYAQVLKIAPAATVYGGAV